MEAKGGCESQGGMCGRCNNERACMGPCASPLMNASWPPVSPSSACVLYACCLRYACRLLYACVTLAHACVPVCMAVCLLASACLERLPCVTRTMLADSQLAHEGVRVGACLFCIVDL